MLVQVLHVRLVAYLSALAERTIILVRVAKYLQPGTLV